jgi:plastocyanin
MTPTEPTQTTPQPDHDGAIIHVTTTNPEQQFYVSTAPSSSSRKKTPLLAVAFLLLFIGIGAYTLSGGKSSNGAASLVMPAPVQVNITNNGFVPATISVKVGQAVTWLNSDTAPHVVASDPYPTDNALAGFDSGQSLSVNDHYSFVFDKAGTYTYHDDLSPYTLLGTVIVKQ